jgi:hypothetical protein
MTAPTSDEAPAGGAAQGFREQAQSASLDFPATERAGQALRVIEGEAKAAQYLACLQTMQADPDELALIVAMLYGATLRGFCRVIEKALGGHHA